jgi:hypothetical protein
MIHRCHDERCASYRRYGGRGISVCSRWLNDFWAFAADMGPKPTPAHTIERIANGGDYTPANCRWATIAEQTRNRRANRHITAFGRTQILTDWAKEVGLSPMAIYDRLKRGWTAENAIGAPRSPRGPCGPWQARPPKKLALRAKFLAEVS